MKNETLSLLIGVSKANVILGGIGIILALILFNLTVAFAFFIGVLVSTVNFVLNGIIISSVLHKNKASISIIISYIVRLVVIVMITILFINNPTAIIAYIIALVLQQVSIMFYKVFNKYLF